MVFLAIRMEDLGEGGVPPGKIARRVKPPGGRDTNA